MSAVNQQTSTLQGHQDETEKTQTVENSDKRAETGCDRQADSNQEKQSPESKPLPLHPDGMKAADHDANNTQQTGASISSNGGQAPEAFQNQTGSDAATTKEPANSVENESETSNDKSENPNKRETKETSHIGNDSIKGTQQDKRQTSKSDEQNIEHFAGGDGDGDGDGDHGRGHGDGDGDGDGDGGGKGVSGAANKVASPSAIETAVDDTTIIPDTSQSTGMSESQPEIQLTDSAASNPGEIETQLETSGGDTVGQGQQFPLQRSLESEKEKEKEVGTDDNGVGVGTTHSPGSDERDETNISREGENATALRQRLNQQGKSEEDRTAGVTDQPPKDKSDGRLNLGVNFNVPVIIIILFIFFVGMLYLNMFANPPEPESQTENHDTTTPLDGNSHLIDMVTVLDNNIKTLKDKYNGQSPRFWSIIHSSLHSVVSVSSPGQPAVIMIAGLAVAGTTDNIARDVANSFPLSNETTVEIRSEALATLSPDNAKEELDTLLESALGGESKTVVVSHIETLPPEALLIFYKYCDNENAPFKQSVIVLTVGLPSDFDDSITEKEEGSIEKFLSESWERQSPDDIGIDQIGALFSRIANSVVIVKPVNRQDD